MGDALMWSPKYPHVANDARIMLFGPAGHGKSTLANNLTSLFDETYRAVAVAARSSDHVTKNNELIRTNAKPNLNFLDLVGLRYEPDNYANGVLKAVATGELPHNFRVLEGNVAQALQEARASGIPATDREMHAAIIVLSYGVRDEEEQVKTKLRAYIQELNYLHLIPIVVITNVDFVTSPEELAALPDQFERITGIEKTRIFLLDNRPMNPESAGFFGQRKTLYKILMALLNNTDVKHRRLHQERGGNHVVATAAPAAPAPATPAPATPARAPSMPTTPTNGVSGSSGGYVVPRPSVSTPTTESEAGRASAQPPPSPLDVVSEWFTVCTEDGSLSRDVYVDICGTNKLADVRSKIETDDAVVCALGQFYFVNTISNQRVLPANEGRASYTVAIRHGTQQPVFLVQLHDPKAPPPY